MRKGDSESIQSISSKLGAILGNYKVLVEGGCNDSCKECILGKVVIKKMSFPYEYADAKIEGNLTICDLLGILLIKGKDALLS